MHKQNPYLKANRKKMAHFKKLLFCQKTFFFKSNFFMQMFNESVLCRQSIELFRHKLWYKLNSLHMHYLYTCHTEKKWWHRFFRCSRAANSVVSGGIWPKVKLIRAFMHVLITYKYEKLRKRDDIVFPIISLWEFFSTLKAAYSVVHGQIWPNFELMQAHIYVII